jgi:hypothetical protein
VLGKRTSEIGRRRRRNETEILDNFSQTIIDRI